MARLEWEAALAARAASSLAARILRNLSAPEDFAVPLRSPQLSDAARRAELVADRIALALVSVGLYVAASLLMQHSVGPRVFRGLPMLAAIGYGLALWFTLKLVRGFGRSP